MLRKATTSKDAIPLDPMRAASFVVERFKKYARINENAKAKSIGIQ